MTVTQTQTQTQTETIEDRVIAALAKQLFYLKAIFVAVLSVAVMAVATAWTAIDVGTVTTATASSTPVCGPLTPGCAITGTGGSPVPRAGSGGSGGSVDRVCPPILCGTTGVGGNPAPVGNGGNSGHGGSGGTTAGVAAGLAA